jgi:aspartate dehydrogenase
MTAADKDLTLAIAGLGAIGLRVARAIDRGAVPGIRLVAVAARDPLRARERLASLKDPPPIASLGELAGMAGVIVECTPAAVFQEVAGPAVAAGRIFMPLSVGALLNHMELVDRAAVTGARIIVPTGAIIGLDTVRAMAEGQIIRVTLETRKPPAGLAGAPHLVRNGIDISNLTEPKLVFKGSARAAAQGFPANVNVAAALALAGLGPELTKVEIWADPGVDRNIQTVSIVSNAGEATMTMRNVPSPENPKTGRIVAQSVLATLRRLTAPLTAGS